MRRGWHLAPSPSSINATARRRLPRLQVLAVGPNDMRMYYHSFDATKQKWVVGVATSKDGFDWTKRGPVFEGGQGSDFDTHGAAAHNVIKDVDSKRYAHGALPFCLLIIATIQVSEVRRKVRMRESRLASCQTQQQLLAGMTRSI